MSSYLYGALTRRRLTTPEDGRLGFGTASEVRGTAKAPSSQNDTVRHWQDALAALVPAEVLVLHGVAMSYGTTTTGKGGHTVTHITYPGQMEIVYVGMLVLAVTLYLMGAKHLRTWEDGVRAVVPALAFVAWTMIQPGTAFDAFPFDLTTFGRIMIGVFLAIALTGVTNWLAGRADEATPPMPRARARTTAHPQRSGTPAPAPQAGSGSASGGPASDNEVKRGHVVPGSPSRNTRPST